MSVRTMGRTTNPDTIYDGDDDAQPVTSGGLILVATIDVKGKALLCFHFAVALQALQAFAVYGRAHQSAALIDFTPASWDAANIQGSRFRRLYDGAVAGNLNAVASGAEGYFEMEVDGFTEVVVKARSASAIANVTPRFTLR